jgi:hypothetical protein
MEPSSHDKIPLCKILYFIGGAGLLVEWKRWGTHNRLKSGHGGRVALSFHPTFFILIIQVLSFSH